MKRGFFLLFALGCGSAARGDEVVDATDPSLSPAIIIDEHTDWGCLRQRPSIARRQPGRVQYIVPVVDFSSKPTQLVIVPDLQVQVCVDAVCSSELPLCSDGDEPCHDLTFDDKRPYFLTFEFPFAFEGVLRFRAPGYVDLHYMLGGPMVGTPEGEMSMRGNAITMLSTDAMGRLYGELGQATVDPTRGVLMAAVLTVAVSALRACSFMRSQATCPLRSHIAYTPTASLPRTPWSPMRAAWPASSTLPQTP